jgi:hypothetical protein
MTRFLPLTLLAASACAAPGAWQPGDPPLRFGVDSPETAELVERGCALWSMTGLECEAVPSGEGDVDVRRSDLDGTSRGWSEVRPCGFLWTDVEFTIRFDPETYGLLETDVARATGMAAHEVGHILVIWGHLDVPSLMDPKHPHDAIPDVWTVTPADLRALPWAEGL